MLQATIRGKFSSLMMVCSFFLMVLSGSACRTVDANSGLRDELPSADDIWNKNVDMAILSNFIYQLKAPDKDGILLFGSADEERLLSTGYDLITYDKGHGEWAIFLKKSTNDITVTFRGSNPGKMRDYPTNLDIRYAYFDPHDPTKGKVARGYLFRWVQLRNEVYKGLAELMQTLSDPLLYKINITGHSLGGAVATLASLDMFSNRLKVQLYSFSAPYFADDTFANFVRKSVEGGMFTMAQEVEGDSLIKNYPGKCAFQALEKFKGSVAVEPSVAPYLSLTPLEGQNDAHFLENTIKILQKPQTKQHFAGSVNKLMRTSSIPTKGGFCRPI